MLLLSNYLKYLKKYILVFPHDHVQLASGIDSNVLSLSSYIEIVTVFPTQITETMCAERFSVGWMVSWLKP